MAGITSLPLLYLETKGLIFLPLQSSGISFSEAKTSPLLACFPPKCHELSQLLLENIWERGREGAVKWQRSALAEGSPARLHGAGGQISATAQAGSASLMGGAGAIDLPVCLSIHAIHPTRWARTPAPPALGSPGISNPFCLCFWPTTEDFSWLHFLNFGSYKGLSSSFQYGRDKVDETGERGYI